LTRPWFDADILANGVVISVKITQEAGASSQRRGWCCTILRVNRYSFPLAHWMLLVETELQPIPSREAPEVAHLPPCSMMLCHVMETRRWTFRLLGRWQREGSPLDGMADGGPINLTPPFANPSLLRVFLLCSLRRFASLCASRASRASQRSACFVHRVGLIQGFYGCTARTDGKRETSAG
jgi:hypothetical protein